MNGNPTAAQKRFHEWCREQKCLICGDEAAIHHIGGSKMKIKGVNKPGEWYVLPLCYNHHQGDCGVHRNKREFILETERTEKMHWIRLISFYGLDYENEFPMSEEEYQIIVARA